MVGGPRTTSRLTAGFNLVEVLIASVILLMSLVGAVQISGRSGVIGILAAQRYEKEAAIDEDLARIQRMNDRFTCVSGSCGVVADGEGDMDKNDYFPDPTGTDTDGDGVADAQESAVENFQNRCRYAIGLDLATPLKTLLDALPQPAGLQRAVTVDVPPRANVNNPAGAHRYTVTYTDTATNEVLRQMSLVPTAVAWCPRV